MNDRHRKQQQITVLACEKLGQKFISSMEEKIREVADIIKRTGKSIYLQVDGGINQETAKQVKAAGADVLVAGSYVFGSKDYAMQINSLR